MHFEYEISREDFRDGQRLAIKKSASRNVRWVLYVAPCVGLFALASVLIAAAKDGLSVRLLPGLVMGLWFLSIPLLSRRGQNKAYTKATNMHGSQSLDVSDSGLRFQGPTFSSNLSWEHFSRLLEDDKVFVIYQQSERIFNILPKRNLNPEQIQEFREHAKHHLVRPA